jgi:hypothetical protein
MEFFKMSCVVQIGVVSILRLTLINEFEIFFCFAVMAGMMIYQSKDLIDLDVFQAWVK